jgi:hypothetical protein
MPHLSLIWSERVISISFIEVSQDVLGPADAGLLVGINMLFGGAPLIGMALAARNS